MKYFAYGSNLNVSQMKSRCPDSIGISTAVLHNYKLVERKYADIEKANDEYVNGALYEISKSDLAALDEYEGYPYYYDRKEVIVTDNAGVFYKAFVYIMTEQGKQRAGSYTPKYRKICSDGAESWGIPNAFAVTNKTDSLWTGNVPDIPSGIEKLLHCVESGSPLPRAKHLWCGAKVIISLKPQNVEGLFGFYPPPFEVVTPHALELSWIFNDLRDLFREKLDCMNKFYFFGELANSAYRATKRNPEISAAALCREVIEKAPTIL
jgi:gamma-glutamylcyclotransferase (GGCT)/AIG2-like uncharacterized protein YtfP